MEYIAYIAAAAFFGLAVVLFLQNAKLHERIVGLDGELKDAKSNKPAKVKESAAKAETKSETITVTDPELERDLDDARTEIKDLKKQLYDLKQNSKDLKQQVKDAAENRTADVPSSDIMFDLRQEISDLKTANVRLEDELKAARTSRKAAPVREEKVEEKREEPKPQPAPAAASGNADFDALKEKFDKELTELRNEARDLDRKLKNTASNVDKQRRRADNNDRAYKITQRQYDAAQERVSLLEAQLTREGFEPAPLPEVAPPVSKKPAKPEPAKAAPAAVVAKPKPKAEPESDSTTVFSGALPSAEASEAEAAPEPEIEAEKVTATLHRVKPIAAEDDKPKAVPPKIRTPKPPVEEKPAANESGGHTAMLTPGAIASTFGGDEASSPAADQSGGHTAVLSSASLSRSITEEANKPAPKDAGAESSEAEQTHTEVLSSGAAFPKISQPTQDKEEPSESGGRRPSAGLFGMPDELFSNEGHDKATDPARSTQFALPTQMSIQDAEEQKSGGGTAKFMAIGSKLGARLGGALGKEDNPADKPVPDATTEDSKSDGRLGSGGGRLGDMDFGDIDSAIDDAWDDLDVD